MSDEPQYGVPSIIEQGNNYAFLEQFSNYVNPPWTAASLVISQGTSTPVSVVGTVSGLYFSFALSSAQTLAMTPGSFDWAIYVSYTGNQATAKQGLLSILPTLANPQTLNNAQIMVQNLQTTLQTLSQKQFKETNFNSQQAMLAEIKDIQGQLVYWESRVIAIQGKMDALRGIRRNNGIGIRFAAQTIQGPKLGYPFTEQ